MQRALTENVPPSTSLPAPTFARAFNVGSMHLSVVKPTEFIKLRIESDGRPKITFGLVYWPVAVARGASTRIAEPSQVESLADVP